MKRIVLSLFSVMLLVGLLSTHALAQSNAALAQFPAGTASPRNWSNYAPDGTLLPGKIKGESAIVIDAYTDKVLFEKDADAKRYPASTTKIMTCLLALESGKSLSSIVTIGTLPDADFAPGSENIGLKNGEMISFGDLLAGMMVSSGNDAADAVAIYVGGSVDNFVDMMNQKAQELGMTGTHYTCTNGLANDENHFTTPRDMSKLALVAVKYEEFVKLTSYATYTIAPTNKTPSARTYSNTNKLLGQDMYGYVYATGIKTGYTSMAQNCLISSANKDNMSLIAVDMGVDIRDNMWTDSVTMFEFGFNFYDTLSLSNLLESKTIPMTVKNVADADSGQSLELIMKPQNDAYITDRRETINNLKNDLSQVKQELSITKDTAPIKRDDKVGTATYSYEGKPVLTCDLIASGDVDAKAAPSHSLAPANNGKDISPISESRSVGMVAVIIGLCAVVSFLAFSLFIIRFWNMRRKGGRYRKISYRQHNTSR